VAKGNGGYYLEFTLAELQTGSSVGGEISLRYKSANTAEYQQSWPLSVVNPFDAVRGGMTALPNAVAGTVGTGLPILDSNGNLPANVNRWLNVVVAGLSASGYLQTMLMRWLTDNAGGTPSALVSNKVPVDAAGIDTVLSGTHGPGNWEGGVTATVNQVRDGILNALLTGFAIQGSVGDAIALAAGLLQGNFIMDTVVQDGSGNGQASARIRVFRDAAATNAGTGEFATFTATTTYTGPNQISVHKVVRV
jgi:hypothetical protein